MTSRVLILNDPPIDQQILDSLCSLFSAVVVSDAREAFDQIDTSKNIDLLIMDIDMKHSDPMRFIMEIDSMEKAENIHKILLCDNDKKHESILKDIGRSKTGTAEFIGKPLNIYSMTTRVSSHLEMLRIQHILDERTDDNSLKLDAILEQAPIGIVLAYGEEPSGDIENDPAIISHMFEKITGRKRKELLELGWAQITHPDDIKKDVDSFNELLSGKINGYSMEKRFIKPDGTIVWTDITVAPLKLKNNTKYKHICLAQDITERKKTEDFLRESERSKSVLLSNLPGMAYRCNYDRNWTMQFVSDGCYDLTGYRPESLLNSKDLSFNEIIKEEYREILWLEWEKVLSLRTAFRMEYEIITAGGKSKWVLETGQGVYGIDGSVEAIEGIIIDISIRKANEIKLKYLSEHDPITGLYNRTYFKNILAASLADNEKTNKAVLILNIKKINSISLSYGYSFSEQIINELAGKLLSVTEDNIKLFQISLERFAFFISGFNDDSQLVSLCSLTFDIMHETQIINSIGCGVGIFKIEDSGCDTETILKNASIAAEKTDKNALFSYRFFDGSLKDRVLRETVIQKELIAEAGNITDNMYLDYQPVFFSKTGRITGFEALARMRSDRLGIVPPLDFIPLAEELQLILPLGLKIICMACKFSKKITDAGYKDIKVAVNVSPIQLLDPNFVMDVIDIIKEIDIDPNNLCLEVTESVFMDNFDLINKRLGKLREIGISVAIDDFGTGYSSLERERELNADHLKIDKTFIDKLDHLDFNDAITGDIISMAHKLGHLVVAEGVETERQKEYLIGHGCDYLQGYLFSRPVDPSSAMELLNK